MANHDYNLTSGELLEHCRDIAESYSEQDLRLTVRQLYYQIVARGLETNGDHVYKRLVSVLSTARLTGQFPMHLIEDRGRDAGKTRIDGEFCVSTASRAAASDLAKAPERHLWSGLWFGQATVPFVWVEKEALSGVFELPCSDLNAGLFACKGYPSLQSLWAWMEDITTMIADQKTDSASLELLDDLGIDPEDAWSEIRVLYFGDHDPDGLEIPESALRNIHLLDEHHGDELPATLPTITFERIALTREQIREFNPPPFPAKESSARFAKYVDKTGLREAWELDALDPKVLQALITKNVRAHLDDHTYHRVQRAVSARRVDLRTQILDPEWARKAVGGK